VKFVAIAIEVDVKKRRLILRQIYPILGKGKKKISIVDIKDVNGAD